MKRTPPVKLVPAAPKPKAKPPYKVRSALDKPFDAFRVVVGLLAGQDDPATFESYEAAFGGFRDVLYNGEATKALAAEDRARCLKVSAGLDRDNTPKLSDDDAKALIPLLDWLDKACVGVLATTAPTLAKAAKKLLLSLSATTYMERLTGMEAIIAKGLRTTGEAGVEVTRRKPPSKLPGYVPDSRVGTVALTAHVPLALRTAIHKAAKKSKLSTQDYLIAVLTAAAAQQQPDQEPVKVNVADAIEDHLDAKRSDARKAALRLAASLR